MLKRPITTIELIQLNRMFSSGRGYKDLIRDFKNSFNVDISKQQAKHFMASRSWSEVLEWLTGDKIQPDENLDKIQAIPSEKFELLEQMIKVNSLDNVERERELTEFEASNYYIPEDIKFFNLPLFGEIITYKWREPFIKCFLFSTQAGQKRKLEKIEDVPISDQLPPFLLRIIRKINASVTEVKMTREQLIKDTALNNNPNRFHLMSSEEIEAEQLKNIFDSPLFKKYNIVAKV